MNHTRGQVGGVFRRWIALAVVGVVVAAGYYWWQTRHPQVDRSLRRAGSAAVAHPIGQLALIAAMDVTASHDRPAPTNRKLTNISDSRIRVAVAVKLEDMDLPVEPLDIAVDDRKVTVSGPIEDALLRDAVEVTIRSVEGVRQVENRLEVVGEQ